MDCKAIRKPPYAGKNKGALGRHRQKRSLLRSTGETLCGRRRARPFHEGAHPDYVRRAVEDSLRRLNTDYIDLYQLHKPDPSVPIEDTLGTLQELVSAGKVREIGCSNFSSSELDAAEIAAEGGPRFVSVQNEYNLLHREPEKDVLQACERLGLGFVPFFPLASGLLTGKYRLGQPAPEGRLTTIARLSNRLNDDALAVVESLIAFAERHGHSILDLAFAERHGHSILDLAFAWLLAKSPVTSVIAGAMSVEQLRQNVRAASWQMADELLVDVDALVPSEVD